MIAVLIAKIVGALNGCTPPKDFPACNTFEFLVPGALIGVIALPAAAILRLRRGRKRMGPETATEGGQSGAS